jgi:hypothetical protein
MWALPLLLLIILLACGILLKRASKFKTPPNPFWPYAANPGLALELADSAQFVNKLLGDAGTTDGDENRKVGRRVQRIDWVFIILYILFLSSIPWVNKSRGLIEVVVLVLLTAIFDFVEDFQILRMLGAKNGSAKRFGQTKWFFFFATVAAEGGLLLFNPAISTVRTAVGIGLGAALIAIGLGGIISSLKGSFEGISSASKLAGLGFVALALTPCILHLEHSWHVVTIAEYAVLMRVPLLLGLVLFALPFIAFFSGAKTLLRGLFDLTPLSLFVVTISSLAVSGTACVISSLILNNAAARFSPLGSLFNSSPPDWLWLSIMVLLGLPVIGFSIWFSARQKQHSPGLFILAALSGAVLIIVASKILIDHGSEYATAVLPWLSEEWFKSRLASTGLFLGYVDLNAVRNSGIHDPWPHHLFAFEAFAVTLVLYVLVGVLGWWQLGQKRTVPALCSALMLMLMIGWMLAALTFFFDAWRVPTLLIVAIVGFLTAQSKRSDHFYRLQLLDKGIASAPLPAKTLTAPNRGSRVIVVAANGGGIQAGAWTAQVLYGLNEEFPKFQNSLCMISSVSGGSVGNMFFVHWLADKVAKKPHEAAAMSSLDEVAWGLAWPDFLRALCPWLFGGLIGRGRALERAWLLNCISDLSRPNKAHQIDKPLSNWNDMVTNGNLPAVVMNATITETGERLLLGTTQLRSSLEGGALVDGIELHTINGEKRDVAVVTAARLSASFPYVTPAARSNGPGPQPHVVDGGYYDNYGMATMVEWLDAALQDTGNEIESVLVIQIHGAPVSSDLADKRHAKTRGWFFQAFAPISTLLSVRSAGQVAHNNIELELLQQKWSARVPIHTAKFEFGNPDPPLSWHLTPLEVADIRRAWQNDMADCRKTVGDFLDGVNDFSCGCTICKSVSKAS